MIRADEVRALKAFLFRSEWTTVFAIVEGATVPDLPATLAAFRPEYRCLYRGELEPDMAEVAPYLVALDPNAPFFDWLLTNWWGRNWGIFGVSQQDIRVLNRYLRQLVKARYGDRPRYFRYYDPTVLRHYLPTCTRQELNTVFGPVLLYLAESDDPQFARLFSIAGGELQQNCVQLKELQSACVEPPPVRAAGIVASAVVGSLVLRPEQLRQSGESAYVERMRDYLNECFPESGEVPREEMARTIIELTRKAAGYKLILETHVAPFIVAAWVFGTTFDEDFNTVKAVLEDYEMDTGRKAQWLWDFIEETVGILEDGLQ